MKKKLSVLAALCALFVLLTASQEAVSCCKSSLKLCINLIIPSLFPFFVLSGLLNNLGFPQLLGRTLGKRAGKFFNVSGTGFSAFFIGICGGYPLGAVYIAAMEEQGKISPKEAEVLLGFCNNTGPAFLIGAVGSGVFHSVKAGLLLYIIHIISALICGLLLSGKEEFSSAVLTSSPLPGFSDALSSAVKSSVLNMLNVCGFVLTFGVFTGLLEAGGFLPALCNFLAAHTGIDYGSIRAFLIGLFELGGGVGAMEGFPLNRENLALAAFMVGFGGLSVHFQTLSAIADKDIKSARHFVGRVLSAALAAVFAYIAGSYL